MLRLSINRNPSASWPNKIRIIANVNFSPKRSKYFWRLSSLNSVTTQYTLFSLYPWNSIFTMFWWPNRDFKISTSCSQGFDASVKNSLIATDGVCRLLLLNPLNTLANEPLPSSHFNVSTPLYTNCISWCSDNVIPKIRI